MLRAERWPVVYWLCASGPHTFAPPLRCPHILPLGSTETAYERYSAVSWVSADSQQAIPLTWPDRDPEQAPSVACSWCRQEAAPNSELCSPFVLSSSVRGRFVFPISLPDGTSDESVHTVPRCSSPSLLSCAIRTYFITR